jgi:integrase
MPAVRVEWQHLYQRLGPTGPRTPTLVPPKDESRRTLVVPPFLDELLKELLDSHTSEWAFITRKNKSLLTTAFYDYYWEPMLGAPERVGTYARPAIPAIKGLETLVPHGLRHSHKVWLDEDGHPRVVAEERMGHVVPGVEGVYSHVTEKMEQRVADSLQVRWEESLSAWSRGRRPDSRA